MGEEIHWELCKRLKVDHTIKGYMHKLESALKNETHQILCDFDIQMGDLISTRRPELVLLTRRKELIV